jgi:hypothetical protein
MNHDDFRISFMAIRRGVQRSTTTDATPLTSIAWRLYTVILLIVSPLLIQACTPAYSPCTPPAIPFRRGGEVEAGGYIGLGGIVAIRPSSPLSRTKEPAATNSTSHPPSSLFLFFSVVFSFNRPLLNS